MHEGLKCCVFIRVLWDHGSSNMCISLIITGCRGVEDAEGLWPFDTTVHGSAEHCLNYYLMTIFRMCVIPCTYSSDCAGYDNIDGIGFAMKTFEEILSNCCRQYL